MIDLMRARLFVEAHGSAIDLARLHALLDHQLPAAIPTELKALQNNDGGFALAFNPGRPSALSPTAYALTWLRDLNLAASTEAQRALDFIAQRQTPRGLWRENPALQVYNPPPWMDPESPAADVYTTAQCASALATFSDAYELEVEQAVAWLQTQQSRDGLLIGFKAHSSWLAVPAFAAALEHDTRSTRRLIGGLGELLSSDWDAAMLAWLLQALLDGGYTRRTQLVNRAWQMLQSAQQPDGSFAAEDEDAVLTTLQAIDVAQRITIGA